MKLFFKILLAILLLYLVKSAWIDFGMGNIVLGIIGFVLAFITGIFSIALFIHLAEEQE
jgi:undecaprenyl pyrophosphate phosphatase UppP